MTTLRPADAGDSESILLLTRSEPLFTPEEVETVEELLTDYLTSPDHNGYSFLVAEDGGRLLGFACFGPRPLTKGTFDLYWLCVASSARRQGVGRALVTRAEDEVRKQRGRLMVIETSGRPEYSATRAFYERLGYTMAAAVPEFYGPGDDLILYTRKVTP